MSRQAGAGRDPHGVMTLGGHLNELRKRLTVTGAALVSGMVAGFALSGWLLNEMQTFIAAIEGEQGRTALLNFTEITAAFDLRLQLAFTVRVVLSSPVWLYQLWSFIVPALTRREKGYALGFVGAAVPLFAAGCAAGW